VKTFFINERGIVVSGDALLAHLKKGVAIVNPDLKITFNSIRHTKSTHIVQKSMDLPPEDREMYLKAGASYNNHSENIMKEVYNDEMNEKEKREIYKKRQSEQEQQLTPRKKRKLN
jgi:hypothetical protein